MLLQPYIENAVWHGLRYKTEKGHLQITVAKKSDKKLQLLLQMMVLDEHDLKI